MEELIQNYQINSMINRAGFDDDSMEENCYTQETVTESIALFTVQ